MNDQVQNALINLGDDGITAFYVYLAVEYIPLYIVIGLIVWGVRAAWKHENE